MATGQGRRRRGPTENEVTDALLVDAARRRILNELQGAAHGGQNSITNNLYGGGGSPSHLSGVQDLMNAPSGGEDPYDYMVDIERKSLADDPKGWVKRVHRYRTKKANG